MFANKMKISTLRVIDADNLMCTLSKEGSKLSISCYDEEDFVHVKFENGSFTLVKNVSHFYASKALKKSLINITLVENQTATIKNNLVDRIVNENLNPMLYAYLYQELRVICGMKQLEMAKLVNKKQGAISNKMRLLKLPLVVQAAMLSEKIKERHGRELLQLVYRADFTTIAEKVIAEVISKNLNVQQTVDLIYRIEGRPVTKLENLRLKNISDNLKKRELKIVINEINNEMLALNEKIKKHFPKVDFELSEGISGEDYVFLLKMRGVNKDE